MKSKTSVATEKQMAFMMVGGDDANVIVLAENGDRYYTDLTAGVIGEAGTVDCYVRIEGENGAEWSSAAFQLIIGDVPDVEVTIEREYPTAVSQMLQEMASHDARMDEKEAAVDALTERAETAAVDAALQKKAAQASAAAAKNAADNAEETADLVLEEAKQYTDRAIAGIPMPDVSGPINAHNAAETAHSALLALFQKKLTGVQGQVVGFDENGNAVAQEPSGGVSNWNELQGKPVVTVGGDTLTWDGNTEGLVSAGPFCKVSADQIGF